MKKLLCFLVIAGFLSGSAYAGIIDAPPEPPPCTENCESQTYQSQQFQQTDPEERESSLLEDLLDLFGF